MEQRNYEKKKEKGFTLAELLIVVAIIAVLVAIGIPIFTSQLEKKPRSNRCRKYKGTVCTGYG